MKQYDEKKLNTVRSEYAHSILLESEAAGNPFDQFGQWISDAEKSEIPDYNAFTLSTNGDNGFPHSRILLLREFDRQGLVFFTNYGSNKGKELEFSDKVCLSFFWNILERQIRVYGVAHKVSNEESDDYFNSRPYESKISAWASIQSSELRHREELEANVAKYKALYPGPDVPRPDFWGGYRVVPHYFEFWQGRPSRLHYRLIYKVDADFEWFVHRLNP